MSSSIGSFFRFAARGRREAVLAASAAGLATLVLCAVTAGFPPLLLLVPVAFVACGAVVALTALRQGTSEALQVALVPALLALAPVVMLPRSAIVSAGLPLASLEAFARVPFAFAVLAVMPAALAGAWWLRERSGQGGAIGAVVAVLAVVATGMALVGFDPAEWFLGHTRIMLDSVGTLPPEVRDALPPAPALEGAREATGVGTGIFVGTAFMWAIIVLMTARWAHAMLDNPGGFGVEFRALTLDWRIAVAGGACAALAMLGGSVGAWGAALLALLMTAFILQALAVAHALVRHTGGGRGRLTAIYALLVFPLTSGPVSVLAALLGVADCWMNFRARAGASG